MAVRDILQEVPDDRRRDHVADILRHIAGEALKRDADDFPSCITGPPELPGLIAASIWIVRCESMTECA